MKGSRGKGWNAFRMENGTQHKGAVSSKCITSQRRISPSTWRAALLQKLFATRWFRHLVWCSFKPAELQRYLPRGWGFCADGTDLQALCLWGSPLSSFFFQFLQCKHTTTQQGMVRKLDVCNTKIFLPYVLSSAAITNKCLIELLSKELLPRKISSIWLHQCIF